MRLFIVLLTFLLPIPLLAQNEYPEITNLSVVFEENTQTLIVNYDLFDTEDDLMQVDFLVSNDEGQSYTIETGNATGDLGASIQSGNGKSITWEADGLLTGGGNYLIKLVADDLVAIDIQSIVDQVDSNKILKNVEFIEGVRHRNSNPNHLNVIKDSIEQRFVAAGLDSYREDFLFGNYTGQNIIGYLEGTTHTDSTYIIDGHFDTVTFSPGADDNGSALGGLLEVVRVLAPYRFNKNLRFIGFDLEEEGLKGSIDYLANGIAENETIKGAFNMDMIGYYSEEPNSQVFPNGFEILYPDVYNDLVNDEFRGNFITTISDENSTLLQTAYNAAAAQYVPELKIISLVAPEDWSVLTPDLGSSDHAPFWLENIPALSLSDGADFRNPNYHSENDTLETLNFTFIANVVKTLVGALAEEAGIEHSTVAIEAFSVTTDLNTTLGCDLQISPIPVNETLQLSFEDCDFKKLKIQIFDTKGKLVIDRKIEAANSGSVDLNLANLQAGLFLLRLSDGKREMSQKLLIE